MSESTRAMTFSVEQKHNTYIAPQAATAAAAALYVTDKGRRASAALQLIDCRLSTQARACSFTANKHMRSPGLLFNGLYPSNPCDYIGYYSFTDSEGMKS